MIQFVKAHEQPPNIRFVDEPSTDAYWLLVHLVADRKYTLFRRLVLDAWGNWRAGVDPNELFRWILSSDTRRATTIIDQAWMAAANEAIPVAQSVVSETVVASAQRSIAALETQLSAALEGQVSVRFGGPASMQVQDYVRRNAGRLITRIGETERAAIRELLLDGVRSSRAPAQVAQDIRQFIGVTHPQAQTLMRLRATMEAAGIKPSVIQKRIEARTRKMIRQRAQTIARNESILASKAGNRIAYMEAVQQGFINLNTARRFWIVARDERLCPRCAPIPSMNPDGRRLDEPYTTPIGPLLQAHAHIICRCTERIEI